MDIFTYCNNQTNFIVVLVGLKKGGNSTSNGLSLIDDDMIEKFQQEHEKIISYSFIDLAKSENLKEPFEVLLKYFSIELTNGRRSIANINYNNYSTISRGTPSSQQIREIDEDDASSTLFKKRKTQKRCCNIL
jgi:hypothetical protein